MLCSSDFWPGVEYCVFKKKKPPQNLNFFLTSFAYRNLRTQRGGSKCSPGQLGKAVVGCCVTVLFTHLQTAQPWGPSQRIDPSTYLHPGLIGAGEV